MSLVCTGRGSLGGEHCCWIAGNVCVYLERGTVKGRVFVCGLRRQLGSWERVHADPRYQPIKVELNKVGVESCGGWQPRAGECCREGVA